MFAVLPLKENGFSRFFHWLITLESVWVVGTCRWLWCWLSWGFCWWPCLFVFVLDWLFVLRFGFRSGNFLPLRVFRCWFDPFAVGGDRFGSRFGRLPLFGAAYFRRFTLNRIYLKFLKSSNLSCFDWLTTAVTFSPSAEALTFATNFLKVLSSIR